MTSSKRSPDSPIESVTLTLRIEGDKDTLGKVREAVPSAVVRDGGCEISMEAKSPMEAEALAKEVLERLRKAGVR
ncbi:MAG TPA: hypothetical protein VEB67_01100 [Nitrososphaerales archaeon]|nr:hypothetical protein [Nitrososphaerales archaeon]